MNVRSNQPLIRRALRPLRSRILSTVNYLHGLGWLCWRRRPRLNFSTWHGYVRDSDSSWFHTPSADTTSPIAGSALIQISFHANYRRLRYLAEVFRAVQAYPVNELQVVVHTNEHRARRLIHALNPEVVVVVHTGLKDPFDLTWCHRSYLTHLERRFDIYAYLEDDIVIPPESFTAWYHSNVKLERRDFYSGFYRVELNESDELVLSDEEKTLNIGEIVQVENELYLRPAFPYQACWVATKQQLLKWQSECESQAGPTEWGIRERAAAGPAFSGLDLRNHRKLVPLDPQGSLPLTSLIFHLPCNYGLAVPKHKSGLGSVALSIFQARLFEKISRERTKENFLL